MDLKQITIEALHLPENDRVELAQTLLLSLESASEDDILNEWLLEASYRAKDINNNLVQALSAEEVHLKAKRLLR